MNAVNAGTETKPMWENDPEEGPLPVPWDMRAGFAAFDTPDQPPPGANDPNFMPTEEHPRPVLLLHAFMGNQSFNFQAGAPFLRNHGYCVFTMNWGMPKWAKVLDMSIYGCADLREAGQELAVEVERIKRLTGVPQIDLVGHSSGGGLLMEYYLNVLEGYPNVDKAISVAPSNHGVSSSTLAFLFRNLRPSLYELVARKLFPLCDQGGPGSEMVDLIYGQGDTRPGPQYTVIQTEHDQVVTPLSRGYLEGDNVTNILLQDGCPDDYSEHTSIIYNKRAWLHVLNALEPENAKPVPAFRVDPYLPGWR